MKPELVLGTVQLGLDYGITNKEGQVSINEASLILEQCKKDGIKRLDTAQAYGDSEKNISNAFKNTNSFMISSKLKHSSKDLFCNSDIKTWNKSLKNSLKNLKINSLDCLFVHKCSDLLRPDYEILLEWLLSIKTKGLAKRIGVSIYIDDEINKLPLHEIDLVQIPISIFDQRSFKNGTIEFLSKKNIEIQARSIFLQGLTLINTASLPLWVSKSDKENHAIFCKELERSKLSAIDYSLSFFKNKKEISSITFGVQNHIQLKEIITSWNFHDKNPEKTINLNFTNNFLDPRKWPKN